MVGHSIPLQITYDPFWKERDLISAEIKNRLKAYYGQPLFQGTLSKQMKQVMSDYWLFGEVFPTVNMTMSLGETGDSIWS
jgi:hypothetical protein